MAFDIAQKVTDMFIDALENGEVNDKSKLCWNRGMNIPANASTGNRYRGINVLLLWMAQQREGYKHQIWGTFKQWQKMGYSLKDAKGKGQLIVFWKFIDTEHEKADGTKEKRKVPLLRYSTVFNCEHADGFEPEINRPQLDESQRIPEFDAIIDNTGANIVYEGDQPCYIPSMDIIKMPEFKEFHTAPRFYGTMFHELTHWTGSKARLDRNLSGRFGDEAYAMEELIAELSAAFTCASLGMEIDPREDHGKYIKSWLKKLKEDKKAIITASSKAAQASEYILESDEEIRDVA